MLARRVINATHGILDRAIDRFIKHEHVPVEPRARYHRPLRPQHVNVPYHDQAELELQLFVKSFIFAQINVGD